ncbi:DUF58 domain-containing protein [Aquibacillus sp. 3ASR75-11]|uniref:DUF58 domain-containing protein n=1 Tax=Terrihalobacillus insolitus TaxID=2950438 RepID=A0A9X3WTH9_9BACI|nr:DUF58 domain-containing protein [Terrihalobacillus insolitus]MDC3414215.1 DUF58 domain-containing protein [Terrihalobacillus insolitus]MDC3425420.1 DUF58 domain-containing protein [Terrihalobacillus insolitus]
MKGRIKFTFTLLYVLLLFFVLFAYAMFQGGFVSWFLFYSFVPVQFYMILLLFYPISRWKIERKLSKRVIQAGDSVRVDIFINRKVPFPIYYCIMEEVVPASLHRKDTHIDKFKHMDRPDALLEQRIVKKIAFPWFSRTIKFHYSLSQIPRGEHHFHAIKVKTGDFFGFIKKEHQFDLTNHVLAYPFKREIKLKDKVSSFEEGVTSSFQTHARTTNVVSGVREYAPGDRFSLIDWKTTARKNAVMTKEYEQEKSTDVLFVLDSVFYHGLNPLSYEASVELATSIFGALKTSTTQLAFMSIGSKKAFFPYHQDPAKHGAVNRFLATVRPGKATAFPEQLETEMQKLSDGFVMIIVLTNFNEKVTQTVKRLRLKSKRVILFFVKPASTITEVDKRMMQELSLGGVIVNLITEEQLMKRKFEVNT